MALFIALGTSFFPSNTTLDLIAISNMDTGYGETNISTSRTQVTYARTLNDATCLRLDDLVNNNVYVSPPDIIIFAVDGSFLLADGTPITSAAGIAIPVGDPLNPTAADVVVIYDTSDCNGNHYWVDKQGGGTTDIPTPVMLYHELSHCFHFVTGTTAATSTQEEVNAEMDENVMRDLIGSPDRDVTSHNGGCGNSTDPSSGCCIIASISTGSPYSKEVWHLRAVRDRILRKSEVGDDFFKNFFYTYYSFSPEVCNAMANNDPIRELVKLCFVTPVIYALELIVHYTNNKGQGLAHFLRQQFTGEDFQQQYNIELLKSIDVCIETIKNTAQDNMDEKIPGWIKEISGIENLFRYLNKDAVTGNVIKWSLIDTLHIWIRAAIKMHNEKPAEEIEVFLYNSISEWIALFPVTDVWNEFSRIQTEIELENLSTYIFDADARMDFAGRLINKHPAHKETILKWSLN